MEIIIQLRKVLRDYKLEKRGIVQQIARDLELHRHTVAALYRGTQANPSMDTIGQVCGWLIGKGVQPDVLPAALFGSRPDRFWETLAASKNLTFFTGEYEQHEEDLPVRLWTSSRDLALTRSIIENLNAVSVPGRHPKIHHVFVPFHFSIRLEEIPPQYFEEDTRYAKRLFATDIEGGPADSTSVMIGSGEVNYLVECWTANLFGCEAFKPADGKILVPLYFKSRHPKRKMMSCFGGIEEPPASQSSGPAGIYYLTSKGWTACPYIPDKQDIAVVMVAHQPGAKILQIAMFGYSGWATRALGPKLVSQPGLFWPPYHRSGGREVGIYVCRFAVARNSAPRDPSDTHTVKRLEVIPLDKRVLAKFI